MPDGRIGLVQYMFDLDGENTECEFLSEAHSGLLLQPVDGKVCYFSGRREG